MTILADSELKEIHSARYRTKSVESLLAKYIRKKALLPEEAGNNYNIEKYRPMNKDNYYKIITDLIGIRILIRYQQQWKTVHKWIWENFHKEDRPYIKNWLDDYPSGETDDFLVEKPKLYLRDNKDLPIYDEAWGECTHDLVYKCKNKARRAELERLSECLAIQTQAAGMISDMMFDKSKLTPEKEETQDSLQQQDKNLDESRFEKLQKRIKSINDSQKKSEEFDGAIDKLF